MKKLFSILVLSIAVLFGMAFAWAPQSWIQVSVPALAAAFYQTIQTAGSAAPQEPILNFPSGMTCVDNPGATRTDCTPSGGGGRYDRGPSISDPRRDELFCSSFFNY